MFVDYTSTFFFITINRKAKNMYIYIYFEQYSKGNQNTLMSLQAQQKLKYFYQDIRVKEIVTYKKDVHTDVSLNSKP